MSSISHDPQTGVAAPPTTASAAAWQDHEHTAELTHSYAQQLIESAGSPELAKHAVEVAAEEHNVHPPATSAGDPTAGSAPSPSAAQAQLAKQLGYASYLDLFEASKFVGGDQSRHWLTSVDSNGKWTLWNDANFEIVGRFDSQDAAASAARSSTVRRPR